MTNFVIFLCLLPMLGILALVLLALVCTVIEARPRWPRADEVPPILTGAGAGALVLASYAGELAHAPISVLGASAVAAGLAWNLTRLWLNMQNRDH